MYSQNNEDNVFSQVLPQEGVLVDIGAFDGKTISNSRLLLEKGWKGFLVEPSPAAFEKLLKTHRENDNVDLLNAAILPNSPKEEKFKIIDFYESELSLISTTSKEFSKNDCVAEGNPWNNPPYKIILTTGIQVDVILQKVLEKWKKINFLSIDAEGISSEIALSIDFSKYDIKCICIEVDKNSENILLEYFNSFGYHVIHKTPENLILIKIKK